jgi:hypothetical protein
VLPVTSGHRITLTYQLYVSEHLGGVVSPNFPTADPRLYPLFQSVRDLLSSPAFMKKGGILGFHCTHQYAHTDGTANQRFPHALKGIDVVLFTIFRSLNLKVHVRPVIDETFSSEEEGEDRYNRPDGYVSKADTITRAAPEFREIVIIGEETTYLEEDSAVSSHYSGGLYNLTFGF